MILISHFSEISMVMFLTSEQILKMITMLINLNDISNFYFYPLFIFILMPCIDLKKLNNCFYDDYDIVLMNLIFYGVCFYSYFASAVLVFIVIDTVYKIICIILQYFGYFYCPHSTCRLKLIVLGIRKEYIACVQEIFQLGQDYVCNLNTPTIVRD